MPPKRSVGAWAAVMLAPLSYAECYLLSTTVRAPDYARAPF